MTGKIIKCSANPAKAVKEFKLIVFAKHQNCDVENL